MILSEQQRYITKLSGNVLVKACPGAGKTRTLVARANYKLSETPYLKWLALITYTNAAADEIYSRIEESEQLFIGTLHSFCLEYILRPFSWIYGWKKPKIVNYEDLKKFISELSENYRINLNGRDTRDNIEQLNKIKRNPNGTLDKNIEGWRSTAPIDTVANYYFQFLDSINSIDFNEILYKSYKIISENDFVCTAIANMFHEILVDEFQDINTFQYEILKKINLKNKTTFFMVGDPNQAIMGFAGAIDDVFVRTITDFNAQEITLTETYRSTSNIINAYSSIIYDHPKIENKSEYAEFSDEIGIYECSENGCSANIWNGCYNCSNNTSIIKELIDSLLCIGVKEDEIAVLSPWKNDCFKITQNLGKDYNFVGICSLPHSVIGINDSTFYLIHSLFRFLLESSMKNLRNVKRSIERHLLENNIIHMEDLNSITNLLLIKFFDIRKNIKVCEGLLEIKTIIDEFFGIEHNTIIELIKRISERGASDWLFHKYGNVLSGIKGIYNDTIHSAKGLEFDAVILNHINERRIPHYIGMQTVPTQESIKNGEKVIYVALSRPKKHLNIIHNTEKSRFLDKFEITKKIVCRGNLRNINSLNNNMV